MVRIASLLVIVACLTLIGCQPPEAAAGVSKEEFDALKTQVETLQTDLDDAKAALESLTADYNMHMEKHHKVTIAPKPSEPAKPPKEKVK